MSNGKVLKPCAIDAGAHLSRIKARMSDRDFTCMTFKANHVRAIAQFRLGVHWLRVEKGRSENLSRSKRWCQQCMKDGCVEDEVHLMVCPAYDHIRESYPALFQSAAYM